MANLRRRNGNYYVRYVDEAGKQREKKSGRDHATAKALGRKLDDEVAKLRAGLIVRKVLKPLTESVEEYLAELRVKDRTPKYVEQCRAYLERMLKLGKMSKFEDLDKAHILKALGALKSEGLSACTLNWHLTAIRALAYHVGRPLTDLRGFRFNVEADRRLVRRALTVEESALLLQSLDTAKRREQMEPIDRKHLYLTALYTGLRKNELASLTPSSFRLDDDVPVVVCLVADTKGKKKQAVQPLPLEVAEVLRSYLAGRPIDKPVWKKIPQQSARMLKEDCKAVGIDPQGVDIHALRHTYCTRLGLSPHVPPAVLKHLARHHSLELTLKYYTHVDDQSAASVVQSSLTYPYRRGETCLPRSSDVGDPSGS